MRVKNKTELPKRKVIRLADFDYSSHGVYFITICTENRQRILSDIVGEGFPLPKLSQYGEIVKNVILEIPQKYNSVKVDKYVIMPDHIHLLISIDKIDGRGNPSPTVDTVIGWLKYRATKQINIIKKSQGQKVF